MKRREFIQRTGLGASGLAISHKHLKVLSGKSQNQEIAVLKKVTALEDIITRDGKVMLRMEFFSNEVDGRTDYKTRIKVKKGEIRRIK